MNVFKNATQVMSVTADYIYSSGDHLFVVDHNGVAVLRIEHSSEPGRALISDGVFKPHLFIPPHGKRPTDLVFVGVLPVNEMIRLTREIFYEYLLVSASPSRLSFKATSQSAEIEYEYDSPSTMHTCSVVVAAKFMKVLHYICLHSCTPQVEIYMKNGILLFAAQGVELELYQVSG